MTGKDDMPDLYFDERDAAMIRRAVHTLVGESAQIDKWEYACQEARKIFTEILSQERSMTAYLGGTPLDSAIATGVLYPVYKGVGVVFIVTEPSGEVQGAERIPVPNGVGMSKNQNVLAKFWCAASLHI